VKNFVESFSVKSGGKLDFDGNRAQLNIYDQTSNCEWRIGIATDETGDKITIGPGSVIVSGAGTEWDAGTYEITPTSSKLYIDKTNYPDIVKYDMFLLVNKNHELDEEMQVGSAHFEAHFLVREYTDEALIKIGCDSWWDGGAGIPAINQHIIDMIKAGSDNTNHPASMYGWRRVPLGWISVGKNFDSEIIIRQVKRESIWFEVGNTLVQVLNKKRYSDSEDDEDLTKVGGFTQVKPYAPRMMSLVAPNRFFMSYANYANTTSASITSIDIDPSVVGVSFGVQDDIEISLKEFDVCVDGENKKMIILASDPYEDPT
jgi:hypothetical protein